MRVSIGIVAWNEAGSIGMTIGSIFQQRLFREHHEGVEAIETVVLANGCTDDTVAVANKAIQRATASCPLPYVTAHVCELPGPDRPGAWNAFVHRLSDPKSDYIVMMDADIYFGSPNTIWSLVRSLEENPNAYASATQPIKDVALKKKRSLKDSISLLMTDMTWKVVESLNRHVLTGGCYCGRTAYWRRIELPRGMRGDDAFLTRMVVTSLLTTPPDEQRIIYPPDASFVFEAYESPWVLFKQHRRRMVGRYIESLIYEDVERQIGNGSADAGEVLRRRNEEDPNWLLRLIRRKIGGAGWCAISSRRILMRLMQLPYQIFPRSILRLPIAILGSFWDLAVAIAATRVMKRNQMHEVWFDTRNQRLVNDQYPQMADDLPEAGPQKALHGEPCVRGRPEVPIG